MSLARRYFVQAKRLQKFFFQHFTGSNRGNSAHGQIPLVVIHNLNVLRALWSPNKAHAPLIVDANAVLTLASSFQHLQLIARGNPQIFQDSGPIKLLKFAERGSSTFTPAANTFPKEKVPLCPCT